MKPINMITLVSDSHEFVARWNAGCCEDQREQDHWINNLRLKGIKASHPDDGWVKRKESLVVLCYPQFDDGLKVGDVLALGDQHEHRLVRITERIQSEFFPDYVQWRFVALDSI